MKHLFILALLPATLFAANPSFQQFDTNTFIVVDKVSIAVNTNNFDTVEARVAADALLNTNVGLVIVTNTVFGLVTNFNTFFLTGGNVNVRSNYTYAGIDSGKHYWTNHLTTAWVISNGATWGGNDYWCIVTNQTVPGETTNSVWYYHPQSDAMGYPDSSAWVKLSSEATGVSVPAAPLAFPSYFTNTFFPTAQLSGSHPFVGPEQSNSTIARIETWGSDSIGRIGGYPFHSWDQPIFSTTNKTSFPIVFGYGLFTNQFGQGGLAPRVPLLDGQSIRGQGRGLTTLGISPGSSASVGLSIGNSNTIESMTIHAVVGATNTARNITNLVINNVVFGTATNIDCIYFGGAGIVTDAHIANSKFISSYDTMNGISTGTFTDCEFIVCGRTNDAAISAGATVRPVYLQGAGSTHDNITLIRPRIFASIPYTNTSPQGAIVIQNTNATLTVIDGYIWHMTNIPAVNQLQGVNPRLNMDYLDVSVDINSNILSSVRVTVSNGVFRTNYLGDFTGSFSGNGFGLTNLLFQEQFVSGTTLWNGSPVAHITNSTSTLTLLSASERNGSILRVINDTPGTPNLYYTNGLIRFASGTELTNYNLTASTWSFVLYASGTNWLMLSP